MDSIEQFSACGQGRPSQSASGVLGRLREALRYRHHSLRTEQAYVYWVRGFIRWTGRRHPRLCGRAEVEGFLQSLTRERQVSASTHKQALCALLFLYREVLGDPFEWLADLPRPTVRRRIPAVLDPVQTTRLLASVDESLRPLARLLYGTGMRLSEGLQLRIKDLNWEQRVIVVRAAKGNKDRVVMLPAAMAEELRQCVDNARALWEQDRIDATPGVAVPDGLSRKYPNLGKTWGWFWVFPAHRLSVDPRSGIRRRHHLYPQALQRALKRAVSATGLDRSVSVHTLRHSFATHLLKGRAKAPTPRHAGSITTPVPLADTMSIEPDWPITS